MTVSKEQALVALQALTHWVGPNTPSETTLRQFIEQYPSSGHAGGSDEGPDERIEMLLACLGDDAAQLREENPEDERAETMDAAAQLIEDLAHANRQMVDKSDRIALDVARWFINGDKPDEWKLKEWAEALDRDAVSKAYDERAALHSDRCQICGAPTPCHCNDMQGLG